MIHLPLHLLETLQLQHQQLREATEYTDAGGWGDEAKLADETDLHGPTLFLQAKIGDRVLMHLNLGTKFRSHGMKTWSVKDIRGAKTLGHIQGAILENATFVAREYGNVLARVLDEKTVHAWVDGKLAATEPPSKIPSVGVPVKYNPHKPGPERHPSEGGHFSFMRQDSNGHWTIPVQSAKRVYLTSTWGVFAEGVVDRQQAVSYDRKKEINTMQTFINTARKSKDTTNYERKLADYNR